MNNPFHFMLADSSIRDVLRAAAEVTPFEFDAAIEELHDDQIPLIAAWTTKSLLSTGAKNTLVDGCLLFLIKEATDTTHCEVFREVLRDALGISKTQAYRKIAAWRHFGKTLTRFPELPGQFVSEALLILSAEQAPPAARSKALELAEQGQLITIKVANQLVEEFTAPTSRPVSSDDLSHVDDEFESEPEAATADLPTSASPSWFTFVGKVARIIINPADETGQTDLPSILADIEAALEKFRQEFALQQITSE